MAVDVVFLSRNHAFEGERRVTLTIEGDLRIASGGAEVRIPLSGIGSIELSAEASHGAGILYTCQIYRRRAWFPVLTLKSKRYRGPNDFADERSGYSAFLAALHAQIIANAWPVKTHVAARPAALMYGLWSVGHWALLIWIAAFFAAVLGLAWFAPPWVGRIPEISVAFASLAALGFLASRLAAIRASYGPWPYDPRAIPASVMPEAMGGG